MPGAPSEPLGGDELAEVLKRKVEAARGSGLEVEVLFERQRDSMAAPTWHAVRV